MGDFKIIFFTTLVFQATTLVHAKKSDCHSIICGQSPFPIRFPFRLQDRQPQTCGFPGFDLTCDSHQQEKPVLNLPNSGDFFVRDINYLSQEIQLYDPNNCIPNRLLSLNLSNTPFSVGYSGDYTLLRCPPESFVGPRFTTVDCLSNSTVLIVATLSKDLVRMLNTCSVVTARFPVSHPGYDDRDGYVRLTWKDPDCEGCEARGGVCGFENSTSYQILCFSNDPGTDKSQAMKIVRVIVLSIVIPAITCSICISWFTCTDRTRATRNLAAVAPPPPPPAIEGLNESTIDSYMKVVLGESRRLPGPNGATCPICLVDYDPEDTLRCIPQCEHCFHSHCVDEWLRSNGSCPVCRNSPSPTRANA